MTIVILQKIGHGLLKAKLCGQRKAKKKEQTVRVGNSVNMFPLKIFGRCMISVAYIRLRGLQSKALSRCQFLSPLMSRYVPIGGLLACFQMDGSTFHENIKFSTYCFKT